MHELEAEKDWRIAELNNMKRLFRQIAEMDMVEYKKVYLKMTVPMTYAHLEGYCVASFKILTEYLYSRAIKFAIQLKTVTLVSRR